MARTSTACELCDGIAALYCAADEAHICWTCDAKVHSANFLVARHTRSVLCGTCGTQTPWKASGANPTPLSGVCSECSQGGAQGECMTHDDGCIIDTARITVRGCAWQGRADSECASGCSSSNPESYESALTVGTGFAHASTCESSQSQLSSDDSEGICVDFESAKASESSHISKSRKRKRAYCSYLPASVQKSKQIATRVSEDVKRSDGDRQCKCDTSTSSSSSSQSIFCADQDPIFVAREDNRILSPDFGINSRVATNQLFPSVKRQSMNDRAQMTSFFSRTQESAVLSISRSMRMLAKWHWDLHLSSPETIPLALRMFREVFRALAPVVLTNSGRRVTLAACLRLAASLDEAQITVPSASEVAACAGVSARRLAMTEIHLLTLLGSSRLSVWAHYRT